MNIEMNRLNSFNNWPATALIDPVRVAKAGFYYTGEGTEVQCFSCGAKIAQWNYGDQVMWRHRRMEPNCAFVVNPHLSGNVPLVVGPACPSDNTGSSVSMPNEGQNEQVNTAGDYGRNEEDDMYKSDPLRLLSFINWDDSSVSRESLVNAGFYHAGGGRLRCAWCGGELAPFSRFGSLGQPLQVHRMYFPRCEHAITLEAAQRPANISSSSSPSDTPLVDTSPQISDNLPQSSGAAHNERLLTMGGTWRSLGVVGGGARHPLYASLAARLASFERWPADRQQAPRTLAEAGFFHTGTDDQVRCFYCDGGLGKWEAGDTPWSEHAHWFPHCGYVLLVKGQDFVDTCRNRSSVQPTVCAESEQNTPRSPGVTFNVTDSQINESMEGPIAVAALGAGLDAARVRRAIVRRLRTTGVPFYTPEALIDAVLDEQLNEEPWSVSPRSQLLARDILAETLRDFAPRCGTIQPTHWVDTPDSTRSQSSSPMRSPSPDRGALHLLNPEHRQNRFPPVATEEIENEDNEPTDDASTTEEKTISLEEENRQLKEARLCKVCMDSEVSVVFLPCGHLVSCARCGAALAACPLCRASVRALVRAYLA